MGIFMFGVSLQKKTSRSRLLFVWKELCVEKKGEGYFFVDKKGMEKVFSERP